MIDLNREAQLQARIDKLEQRNKQLLEYAEKLDSHEAKLQQRIDKLEAENKRLRDVSIPAGRDEGKSY